MKKLSIGLAVISAVVLASFALSFIAVKYSVQNYGAAITQIQTVTTGVWAIASTTEAWSAYEQTGTVMSPGVNSSTTVGTTAVQILAPNTGRVKASVCNNSGTVGFLSFNNSATSTPGATGYFVVGTGRAVLAGACYSF